MSAKNNVYAILQELRSDNSRLAKESILKREQNNNLLYNFFRLALNPFINFYQKKIPEYIQDPVTTLSLQDAFDVAEHQLANRTVTGNDAINVLSSVLSKLDNADAEVLKNVIKKDPECGVSEATVNKIWKNLIPSYPVMLCSPFEQKLADRLHWKRGVYIQKKEDGIRCNIVIYKQKVTCYTRNGREIETFGVFDYLADYKDNTVLDGELLVKNKDGKFLDRKTGNGIINRSLKGTARKSDCENFYLNTWDLIPYEDFVNGLCTDEYESRYIHLQGFVGLASQYSGKLNVGIVETKIIHSMDEANVIFAEYLSNGDEGAILKDRSTIWEDKRSKQQVKLKQISDTDLLVIDVQEGTGKYTGQIGALVCTDADNIITVNVGSGLTDEQRKTLTKDELIGKIVTVTYNAKICAKDGTWSLFLPRLTEIRLDKNEANSFADIK